MKCVIVLGCYRTGTSAVAGVLHHLGIQMGHEFDPPSSSNPKGYFEDLEFKRLLHPLLDNSETVFDPVCQDLVSRREREGHDIWGVKDPKMCCYLRHFLAFLISEPKIISTERDIDDICDSMYRAMNPVLDQVSIIKPLVEFYLDAKRQNLQEYQGDLLEIKFEELSSSPEKIAEFVGLPLTEAANNFIRPSMDGLS